MAATLAAAAAFGTEHKHFNVDTSWLRPTEGSSPAMIRRANMAAEFVRANPDAPVHALPIHLRMNGFRDMDRDPPPRELVAWTVFKTTLAALDRLDADEAAELAASRPQPAAGRLGGERGLQPRAGGMTEAGLTARR